MMCNGSINEKSPFFCLTNPQITVSVQKVDVYLFTFVKPFNFLMSQQQP